jgi:hypothetical protein
MPESPIRAQDVAAWPVVVPCAGDDDRRRRLGDEQRTVDLGARRVCHREHLHVDRRCR